MKDLSDRIMLPFTISSPKILELIQEGDDLREEPQTIETEFDNPLRRDRDDYYRMVCARIGELIIDYRKGKSLYSVDACKNTKKE